jgi:histidyl-tRNA synthetase
VITLLEQFQTAYGQTFPYVVDVQIVRGLDYYTGTVFEAILQKERALGSIAAGGRYGALTGYLDPKRDTYAGVGGSIGISRLLVKLLEQKAEKQQTIAKYVFVHFPETFPDILALAAKFQAEGKNIEIYPVADKLGKQF